VNEGFSKKLRNGYARLLLGKVCVVWG